MNANSITELLATPLCSGWTIEDLAEQLLDTIAHQPSNGDADAANMVLDINSIVDRQTLRLIRPLLACLANKAAAENGTPVNLFGGHLQFQRQGSAGSVWIVGEFENRPDSVKVAFRRLNSQPKNCDLGILRPGVLNR